MIMSIFIPCQNFPPIFENEYFRGFTKWVIWPDFLLFTSDGENRIIGTDDALRTFTTLIFLEIRLWTMFFQHFVKNIFNELMLFMHTPTERLFCSLFSKRVALYPDRKPYFPVVLFLYMSPSSLTGWVEDNKMLYSPASLSLYTCYLVTDRMGCRRQKTLFSYRFISLHVALFPD